MARTAIAIVISFALGLAVGNLALHQIIAPENIEAGDILSFGGSLFGVVLAVAGALFVESASRAALRHEERKPITEALASLNQLLLAMRFPPLQVEPLELQKARALQLLTSLSDAQAVLTIVRDKSTLVSVNTFLKLREIDRIIEANSGMIKRETAMVSGLDPTERIMAIYHANTEAFAEELQPIVNQAIESLK